VTGEKIKISYKAPTDVDKKIIGANGIFAANIAETLLTTAVTTNYKQPIADFSSGSTQVAANGDIKVAITDAANLGPVYMTPTLLSGWTVNACTYEAPTGTKVLQAVYSVQVASNILTIKTVKPIEKGVQLTVRYTAPANAAKILSSGGYALSNITTAQDMSSVNNSTAVMPNEPTWTDKVNNYVYGNVVKLTVPYITSAGAVGDWVVKVSNITRTVSAATVSGNVVTITFGGNAVTTGTATVSYTKGTAVGATSAPMQTFAPKAVYYDSTPALGTS
jgi:hypothetical protein